MRLLRCIYDISCLSHCWLQKILLGKQLKNFRIVIPRAPVRHVTVAKQEMFSWFDIKFRNEKSFVVDFDEAFSRKDVEDSYERVLKPILEREDSILKRPKSIFVGGFSQGCGMALHCLYSTKIEFAGCVGVSGYLFPITPFTNLPTLKRIIYGQADPLRPWQYVKVTYQDKIPQEQIVLVQGMEHEVKKKETIAQLARFFQEAQEHLKKAK